MDASSSEFSILSTDDSVLRLFVEPADWPEFFWAELKAGGLECRTRVVTFEPRPIPFAKIFEEMAGSWMGWRGEKVWESLEGELKLATTMDATGHVTIDVHLRDGSPYGWVARAALYIENGQLELLARQAIRFQDAVINAA